MEGVARGAPLIGNGVREKNRGASRERTAGKRGRKTRKKIRNRRGEKWEKKGCARKSAIAPRAFSEGEKKREEKGKQGKNEGRKNGKQQEKRQAIRENREK